MTAEEIAKNKAKGIALEEVEEELKEQAKEVNMERIHKGVQVQEQGIA